MIYQQSPSVEDEFLVELNMVSCSTICLVFLNIVLISAASLRPEFHRHRETLLAMFLVGDVMSYVLANVQIQSTQTVFDRLETSTRMCRASNRFHCCVVLVLDTVAICVINLPVPRINSVKIARITRKLSCFLLCLFNASSWITTILSMSLMQGISCSNSFSGETGGDRLWNISWVWSVQDTTVLLALFRAIFTLLATGFYHGLAQVIANENEEDSTIYTI